MSTSTALLGLLKAVDGDNARTYLETNLGASLDTLDNAVLLTNTQTLTNKTLTSPTITSPTISGTVTSTAAENITKALSTAFTVAAAGSNYIFQVDTSTASAVAGLKLTGAVTGGTVALAAIDSGSNTNLTIDGKGTGTIGIGTVSTGLITLGSSVTITSGKTLTITGTTVTGAPTWSNNQAITLSTAAQPNVTSLGTLAANLLFTDATYDIGQSGATRPRHIYLSGNLVAGGTGAFTSTLSSAALTVTSASATSLVVGPNGTTTPMFAVDSSTASAVAGLKLTGAATGGTVAVVVTDSGAAANLTIDAKGTGTIGIGTVSTGLITLGSSVTITSGKTLTLTGTTISGSPTWSSNQAITLSTAAQPNVTSLGTLTGLTVSGTVSHTNANPFSMTNGQVVTVALTAQTIGAATLTIPNFAGVSDTFAFLAATQEFTNKTLNASVGKGTWTASGTWTLPAITLGGTVTVNSQSFSGAAAFTSTVSFTGGTFTTSVSSTTALATPGAYAATTGTFFASTVSGATLMGFGTTGDVTLKNRAGTDVIVVTSNTLNVTMAGTLAVTSTLTSTAHTITSASATSIAVGPNGTTTPIFVVDSSTASAVAGLKITGAATGGTVAVVTVDSGSNTNLTIDGKGTGTIGIGTVSTGTITLGASVTVTSGKTLTLSGVTISGTPTWSSNQAITVSTAAQPNITSLGALTSLSVSGTITGTSTSASALTVGANGSTNPVLQVDASTASVVTGLKVAGAASGNGVTLSVISSGSNEDFIISAKGTGKVKANATYGIITADTDGATVTFDMSASDLHSVTLGGNRTLAVSNVSTGQTFTLLLKQDGTGSRTVTWFSGITWAAGTTPTLTTTASKTDIFSFICTGAGAYLGFISGQNY